MIKNSSNSPAYKAPVCKTVTIKARNIICGSNYGNNGEAGGGFDGGNTHDYEDDLL